MKNLQIDEQNARDLYPTADKAFKAMLEDSFGKEFFNQKITDRVKTFQDAVIILGSNDQEVLKYNILAKYLPEADNILLEQKLIIIARALNEGWTPNWDNDNEYKYYPWFRMGSAFVFNYTNYVWAGTTAFGGSRLCFKSRELAEYVGKQFTEIYKEYMTIVN